MGFLIHLDYKWTVFELTPTRGLNQECVIHLQPRLAEFLYVAAKQLVGDKSVIH